MGKLIKILIVLAVLAAAAFGVYALVRRGKDDDKGLKQVDVTTGRTLVIITHDLALARRASRIVEIHDGRITHDGPASEIGAIASASSVSVDEHG